MPATPGTGLKRQEPPLRRGGQSESCSALTFLHPYNFAWN